MSGGTSFMDPLPAFLSEVMIALSDLAFDIGESAVTSVMFF